MEMISYFQREYVGISSFILITIVFLIVLDESKGHLSTRNQYYTTIVYILFLIIILTVGYVT